jgi:hypothetical protein
MTGGDRSRESFPLLLNRPARVLIAGPVVIYRFNARRCKANPKLKFSRIQRLLVT